MEGVNGEGPKRKPRAGGRKPGCAGCGTDRCGMSKADRMWIRAMEFGARMGCHQMASRSFFIRGYQFPVCARCAGVLIGQIVATIQLCVGVRLPMKLITPMIGIMGVDWGLQYLKIKESTNVRRLLTGIPCGIGLTFLYAFLLRGIIHGLGKAFASLLDGFGRSRG